MLNADWGGAIVWRVAMWYPEVIEKLVVMAGPHPDLFRRNLDADQKRKCGPHCCLMCRCSMAQCLCFTAVHRHDTSKQLHYLGQHDSGSFSLYSNTRRFTLVIEGFRMSSSFVARLVHECRNMMCACLNRCNFGVHSSILWVLQIAVHMAVPGAAASGIDICSKRLQSHTRHLSEPRLGCENPR